MKGNLNETQLKLEQIFLGDKDSDIFGFKSLINDADWHLNKNI
jgi:hypothetical protein